MRLVVMRDPSGAPVHRDFAKLIQHRRGRSEDAITHRRERSRQDRVLVIVLRLQAGDVRTVQLFEGNLQNERNLLRVSEEQRRDQLISALNELLYSELLAVKRTLGASHETQLIQLFREMQDGV